VENDAGGRQPDWSEQLRAALAAFEHIENGMAALNQWLWDNVVAHDCLPVAFPPDVADLLQRLRVAVGAGRSAATEAFERFSARPVGAFVRGRRLSEEEFYVLGAMGILRDTARSLRLSDVTDYEAFSMLYYEDDDHYGYINPELEPPVEPRKLMLRFGIVPESVRIGFLRPEQEEFLRTKLPELYERFLQK
jgi:hypothetical protein